MRKLWLIFALVAAMLVGGIAYASIPGPDGVVHGCYKNTNPAQGALIAVDSSSSCPSGYTSLNWNQTGPQGAPGPAGTNGVSGYDRVNASAELEFNGTEWVGQVVATCPTGKTIIGGGGEIQGGTVSRNMPNEYDKWLVGGSNDTPAT